MSNKKREFKPVKSPRDLHGGLFDIKEYPCTQCEYLVGCSSMSCDAFAQWYNSEINGFRKILGMKPLEDSVSTLCKLEDWLEVEE